MLQALFLLLLIPLVGLGWRILRWYWPKEPLVAFGHPHEEGTLMGWVDDWGHPHVVGPGSDPKYMTVAYLLENREPSALRDVTTGLQTRSGVEHQFEGFFVQILPAGKDQLVSGLKVPPEALSEVGASQKRYEQLLYWARFTDTAGRQWQANYDPHKRRPTYVLLRRGSLVPWNLN
jgi:hypothetical protein